MKKLQLIVCCLLVLLVSESQAAIRTDRCQVVISQSTCSSILLEVQNMDGTPATDKEYQWYKDDVAIDGANSMTYAATDFGVYKCLVDDDLFTCSNVTLSCGQFGYKVDVTSTDVPESLSDEECYDKPVEIGIARYISGDAPASGSVFQWYKVNSDGTLTEITGANDPTYNATEEGTYTCKVTEPGMDEGITCTTVTVSQKDYPWLFDNGLANDGDHDWFKKANWYPNRDRIPNIKSNATIKENRIAWVGEDKVADLGVAVTKTLEMRDGSQLVIKPEGRMAIDETIYYKKYNGTDELDFSTYYDNDKFSLIASADDYPVAITIEKDATNLASQGAITIKEGETLKAKSSVLGYATTSGNYDNNVIWQYMAIPVDNGLTAQDNFLGSWITKWTETTLAEDKQLGANWSYLTGSDHLNLFEGYALTQVNKNTYWLEGTLPTSDKTFSGLTWTDNGASDFDGMVFTGYGYHLIGNSYSAPIDVTGMEDADFDGVEKTFYLYNYGSYNNWHSSTGYDEEGKNYNENNKHQEGTSGGQYLAIPVELAKANPSIAHIIPSQQGFFIVANQANASLTFDYNDIVHQPNLTAGKDCTPAPMSHAQGRNKRVAASESPIFADMTISATTEHYSDFTRIFLNEDCSDAFDNGWDGRKMAGSSNVPQIYFVSKAGQWQYAVTDSLNNQNFEVVAGSEMPITLDFNLANVRAHCTQLYLVDLTTNEITDLMQTPSYSYMEASAGTVRRFQIRAIMANNDTTNLMNGSKTKVPAGTYDVLGRRVSKDVVNTHQGVYIKVSENGIKKEVVR